jgi:hypothetical protein
MKAEKFADSVLKKHDIDAWYNLRETLTQAFMAADRAAREECAEIADNEASTEKSYGHPRRALSVALVADKIRKTMEEK